MICGMTDQQLIEKIEAYLAGKLSSADTHAFEADIKTNPVLAEEVELQRLSMLGIDRLAELDLRESFAQWRIEAEAQPPPPPDSIPLETKTTSFTPHAIAIGLFLLIAVAFLLRRYYEQKLEQVQKSRRQTEQALLDANLRIEELETEVNQLREDLRNVREDSMPGSKTDKNRLPRPTDYAAVSLAKKELLAYASEFDVAVRGAKSDAGPAKNRLNSANTAIKNLQFARGERILEGIGPADLQYQPALAMLAYVYVQRNKPREAVSTYRKYMKFDSDQDKTDWNLCLFYLSDYPYYKTEFQTLLNKILGDSDHFYYSRANALRAQLAEKQIWPR